MHPGELVEPAQLGGDLGQGNSNNALVESGKEHAGHQPAHDDENLAMAQVVTARAGDGGAFAARGTGSDAAVAVPAADPVGVSSPSARDAAGARSCSLHGLGQSLDIGGEAGQ